MKKIVKMTSWQDSLISWTIIYEFSGLAIYDQSSYMPVVCSCCLDEGKLWKAWNLIGSKRFYGKSNLLVLGSEIWEQVL